MPDLGRYTGFVNVMLSLDSATNLFIIIVVGVMKMGNTVPRAGIEPISLAFFASVLPLHHVGSLMSPLHPYLPAYVALCLRG